MTGHEALLQMRRAGRKPACVWIADSDEPIFKAMAADWHKEPNPFAHKLFAHIQILETDVPEYLDLRCVIGLPVHLELTRDEKRAKRLFKAVTEALPSQVLASFGKQVWIYPEN